MCGKYWQSCGLEQYDLSLFKLMANMKGFNMFSQFELRKKKISKCIQLWTVEHRITDYNKFTV